MGKNGGVTWRTNGCGCGSGAKLLQPQQNSNSVSLCHVRLALTYLAGFLGFLLLESAPLCSLASALAHRRISAK